MRWTDLIRSSPGRMISNLADPMYREYLWLLARYGRKRNVSTMRIPFLTFSVDVNDSLSFIYQFKDIFYRRLYLFPSVIGQPVIIDCGANIGVSCLFFRRMYPGCRLFPYEADPLNAGLLRTNLQNNGIVDSEVIEAAVWTHAKGVRFETGSSDAGRIVGGRGGKRCRSVRLRDELRRHRTVDFLKMDIEGAEVDVLADCGEALSRVKFLYVEYHAWEGSPQRLHELLGLLTRQGFRYAVRDLEVDGASERNPYIGVGNTTQYHVFASRA